MQIPWPARAEAKIDQSARRTKKHVKSQCRWRSESRVDGSRGRCGRNMASEDEVKALRPPSLLEVLDNRCVVGSQRPVHRAADGSPSDGRGTDSSPSKAHGGDDDDDDDDDEEERSGRRERGGDHGGGDRILPLTALRARPPRATGGFVQILLAPNRPPTHHHHNSAPQGEDGWAEVKPDSLAVRGEDAG